MSQVHIIRSKYNRIEPTPRCLLPNCYQGKFDGIRRGKGLLGPTRDKNSRRMVCTGPGATVAILVSVAPDLRPLQHVEAAQEMNDKSTTMKQPITWYAT